MKRPYLVSLAALTAVICFKNSLLAEDIDLEKIVVTPSRMEEAYGSSSQTVDVITSKEIEGSSSGDLSKVLTDINSLIITDNGGGLGQSKKIQMRGSTAAQVLVLVDGRPINNPRDGSVDLSMLPVDNIARIEVVHGPGSSLYGSQAIGGTVNIITKSPPKEKQKTELSSSIGTFQTYKEQFSQGARIGNFGYLVTGGYQSSGGFRDNSEYNQKDFNTKLEYKINNDNNLMINSGFFKNRVGTPGTIDYPDPNSKQIALRNFIDLNWSFKPDTKTEIKTKVYNNYDRLEFPPGTDSGAKSVHVTQTRGIDLQADRQFRDNYRALLGFNYVANYNDSTDTAKHKYSVRAFFMENQLDLNKNLKLCLSARLDDYSNFDTQFNPSFSAIYKFNNSNKIHGLVSRSYRIPTFNDLYWPAGTYSKGDPNLKPEKGITEEIGFDSQITKRITCGITYYRTQLDEYLIWVPVNNGIVDVWQPVNIGSAVINGIEFSNNISITDNLEVDLNYSFLSSRDDKTHKYIIYQPINKTDISLKYNSLNGFSFEVKGQYTGQRFNDRDNLQKVKPFLVFGLSASKKLKTGLTYYLSLDNLFNNKYQDVLGYPVQGFSATNGLKYEF